MRLVSPLLKRVIYPGLARSGYLRRRCTLAPVALTYHGILPESYPGIDPKLDGNLVSLSAFRQQLRFLKTHFNVIAPREFAAWCEGKDPLPERSVLLTCDDGLRSCIDYMIPALREEKLTCLFFITGASLQSAPAMLWHEQLYLALANTPLPFRACLDKPPFQLSVQNGRELSRVHWELLLYLSQFSEKTRRSVNREIGGQLKFDLEEAVGSAQHRARFLVMNEAELSELARAGMEIGAHTTSHLALSHMPEQLAAHEIAENRAALQRLTGQQIWALAYPFGTPASAGSREYQIAEAAGFTCAFTNCEGSAAYKFALPRIHITREMDLSELEAHLSGLHYSLQNFPGRRVGGLWN
jgi:peptidoglycan/xylan/chitin deacetylase (PgdA/CDA1 family)